MKTIDYIKKYGLDKNNKSLSKLEKDEFFKDLEKELLERIQEREKNYTEDNLPYKIFQNLVKQVNDKFWAISNKKKGIAFTFELWNAFFATQVVPLRKKLFPDIQKFIEERKRNNLDKQDKLPLDLKKGNYGKGNPRPTRK